MAESGYEMLDEEAGDYRDVLQLSKEEIMNKAFRSDEAAYEFYRRLGKCFGFGIRKGDSGKDESGRVIRRRFFCNRAGLRQRHHYDRLDRQRGYRPETRKNCEAKLSVYLDVVSGIWRVRKIVLDHNHYLTPAYMVHMMTNFREIKYGLQNSFWAKETFQKRMMWANAYLQDKFCAGFRTTSRCEGINAYVKNFLKSRHSLVDMVQNLELVVREYQNNELLAQFRSLHGMSVMTTCLDPLEKYAADAYTQEIFVDAKKEIVGVGAVNFVAKISRSTTMVYTLEEYGDPSREVIVLYDRVSRKMECRCNFWSQKGIPCQHIFFVMKHKHLTRIPERLVLKRWRKDTKSLDKYAEITEVGSEIGFLLRHGALHAAAQWMLYVGARSPSSFTQALNGLHTLCQELDRGPENVRQKKALNTVDLHDPVVAKTKGAPRVRRQDRRKRRCTRCRKTGHTKRHCNADQSFVSKVEESKDFEATNLGSEGSLPTEGVRFEHGKKGVLGPNNLATQVCLEASGLKIRLQHEIPVATGCNETMEWERNMISNTDDLLAQVRGFSKLFLVKNLTSALMFWWHLKRNFQTKIE
ncbi:hypothetical protein Ahy_B02g058386 [Arachis hypogaea]|uniref:Uncharacterized protein n=1 Tax=Arachis hypogaea TaxID=3818 RepID=A0A445AEJ0_ARAHY|nr:hypothetical protein Ahy_B02g058386 [Arachis hypogaea]